MAKFTRNQAIKAMCRHCMGGSVSEIPHCTAEYCPIWPYRRGNPKAGSKEEKRAYLNGLISISDYNTKDSIDRAIAKIDGV